MTLETIPPLPPETASRVDEPDYRAGRRVEVEAYNPDDLQDVDIHTVILGLGFEVRTLESAKRVLAHTRARDAIAIRYAEVGRAEEILDVVRSRIPSVEVVGYDDVLRSGLAVGPGQVLVDVTGLAKPALFSAVRNSLRRHGRAWICHTEAEAYYPLDRDIDPVLQADQNRDHSTLLESLSRVLAGERGPYTLEALIESDADESRRRVLCTFASAKHERLLSLLDERDYDRIEIVVPKEGTPRSRIAQIAAEVAGWKLGVSGTGLMAIEANDFNGVLEFIRDRYHHWYVDRGFNFEFGVTGSKIQAVACAAFSAAYKVSQCWYVRPTEFDPTRFTEGVGVMS